MHDIEPRLRLGALLVLFVALVFFIGPAAFNDYELRDGARRGLAWLRSYEGDYGNPGVFWAISEINARYCRSDALTQELKAHFAAYPRTPADTAYFHSLTDPEAAAQVSLDGLKRYDRWLLSALSCNARPIPEDVAHDLWSSAAGYDLTHQYLALSYMKHAGCAAPLGRVSIVQKLAEDAEAMNVEERAAQGFSDLSAERAALLLWGGDGALVDGQWLQRIARAEDPSGGWQDSAGGSGANAHTTALSVWALAQATARCPL